MRVRDRSFFMGRGASGFWGGGAFQKIGLQWGGHAKNLHVPKGGHPKINEHLGNFTATIDV